ncbi:ribosome-associated translation inhibitor RaiA [uncultured Clostridium sp.]|jgi:putative sigma-54 modulation protein|uniref:ribosome hibernation-promoting factor, HPF/YfiA family n=1 Tax=uncultured Clostridium sp. TaxID=59620 RepID=UPI002633DECC|nr:ribosome-associated translation inhibitor RaiA [uncultured Clostridium sp.]
MKVKIHARNIKLTEALKETVEKKVLKLEKYFIEDVEAKVTLSVQKNRHIVEVLIPFNGICIRAEESTDDMYKGIDLVEEKLERQIVKHKTKLKRDEYSSVRYPVIEHEKFAVQEEEDKIVKVKRFDLKPMNAEEAVLQMDLIGHNFFVYRDGETNETKVVYKRKDGHYGLIEPDDYN